MYKSVYTLGTIGLTLFLKEEPWENKVLSSGPTLGYDVIKQAKDKSINLSLSNEVSNTERGNYGCKGATIILKP